MLKSRIISLFVIITFLAPHHAVAQDGEGRDKHDSSTIAAIEKVKKSVVAIYAVVTNFVNGRESKAKSGGSGFIIDPEGHVVTNYHVAAKADKFRVVLWDKQEVGATLVGADPWTDIAVLQLNLDELKGTSLTWSSLGDSDKVVQGESVVSIGMPAGLERTVTKGIVSSQANDRALRALTLPSGNLAGKYYNPIQHDAALYGGNSGGPLCNLKGEVVGVNHAGLKWAAGFAIPINVVKDVFKKILESGEIARSYIGLEFQELEKFGEYLGMDKGTLISHVDEDSPAGKVGINPGDVLLQVNDKELTAKTYPEIPGIRNYVGNLDVGKEHKFLILSNGIEKEFIIKTVKLDPYVGETAELREWGCVVRGMTWHMAIKRDMDSVHGVILANLLKPRGMSTESGPAHKAGMEIGDVIIRMDGKVVPDLETFKDMYKKWTDNKDKTLLQVIRGKTKRFIVLEPEEEKETK